MKPALRPLERGATQLAKGAAAWIRRHSGIAPTEAEDLPADPPSPTEPSFDLLEVERMIHRGEVPPAEVIPFVTSFEGHGLSQKAMSALGRMQALRKLTLSQVSDLAPLAGLTVLQFLNLNHTQVSDLAPLAGLTALQSLHLGHTQVSDLAPLAGLTALQFLDLDGTKVSDLTPFAGLTALQFLQLRYTRVSDLAPLRQLPNLSEIWMEKNNARIATLGLPAEWDGYSYRIKRAE